MIKSVISWLTGGVLDRALDVVERRVANEADRERLKAEVIKTHLETRTEWMRAGGFYLMLMFAVPLAFWFSAVVVYSVLWCANCVWPQDWSVAALPPPLDEWAGGIILSIFGVVGLSRIGRK